METVEFFERSYVKWGLYLGLATVLLTFLLYVIDVALMINFWVNITILVLVIVGMVMSAKQAKKSRGGDLPYGNAVINSLGVSLVYTVIYVLFSALLNVVIDPELPKTLKTIKDDKMVEWYESRGSSEKDIELALENSNRFSVKYDLKGIFIIMLISMAMYFVVGLIVSAFTYKTPPMFEANDTEA